MSEIKDGFERPSGKLFDSVEPGDLIWINDWEHPFQVKCISSNYFVMTGVDDGEQMYTICPKNPFTEWRHNGVSLGDFYCGPDSWTFGSTLASKYKNLYSFTNKAANRKYMKSLEDGETQISTRRMARIDQIRILRMSSFKDPVQFAKEYLGVKLLPYQETFLRLLWNNKGNSARDLLKEGEGNAR